MRFLCVPGLYAQHPKSSLLLSPSSNFRVGTDHKENLIRFLHFLVEDMEAMGVSDDLHKVTAVL